MSRKEIKITVPEGYEIDKENSTFECIKFKKKALTYEDVAKALFKGKRTNYFNGLGNIKEAVMNSEYATPSNVVTSSQAERIYALNKLLNVAEYLNEKALIWDGDDRLKWYIYYNHHDGALGWSGNSQLQSSHAYFDSKEHLMQAIEILGEDTIKTALGVFE
jgi:hypothetical protein